MLTHFDKKRIKNLTKDTFSFGLKAHEEKIYQFNFLLTKILRILNF